MARSAELKWAEDLYDPIRDEELNRLAQRALRTDDWYQHDEQWAARLSEVLMCKACVLLVPRDHVGASLGAFHLATFQSSAWAWGRDIAPPTSPEVFDACREEPDDYCLWDIPRLFSITTCIPFADEATASDDQSTSRLTKYQQWDRTMNFLVTVWFCRRKHPLQKCSWINCTVRT